MFKLHTILAVLIFSLLLSPLQFFGQSKAQERIKRIENGLLAEYLIKGKPNQTMNLLERMKHHKVVGLSVAVINNYQIEWAKGYGVLDTISNKSVTTETLFQAGSISKPVATVGAFKLIQDGKITLDENVNDKLVSWKVPESDVTKDKKATVRGILSHSAGLTVSGFVGYANGETIPLLTQILNGEKPVNSAPIKVDVVPGTQNRYSGGGFTVLQQLMIDVSKQDFPSFMQKNLLEPLKMKRSGYWLPLPEKYHNSTAVGHRANGEQVTGKWHNYPEFAAAGLWTTPSDLARFVIEVQKSQDGKSDKILTNKTTETMLTPEKSEVGLGFGLKGSPKPFRFGHNASTEGYFALMLGYMHNGQGAVIMTNSDEGVGVTMEIMRAIAKEYGWNDLQTTEILEKLEQTLINSYSGVYEAENKVRFNINGENGKLFLQQEGRNRVELIPLSETEFLVRMGGNPKAFFVKNSEGKPEILLKRGTNETKYKKIN